MTQAEKFAVQFFSGLPNSTTWINSSGDDFYTALNKTNEVKLQIDERICGHSEWIFFDNSSIVKDDDSWEFRQWKDRTVKTERCVTCQE